MIRAKKSLGQNFLTNPKIIERIVECADLGNNETVVEVGPGTGALTSALLSKAGALLAVEKDDRLIGPLQERFGMHPHFQLIHTDALTWQPPQNYILVANIPYYITGPLIDHFIARNAVHRPKRAVLLVQKEVAEKICAHPPDMNVLALHVQAFGKPKLAFTVSRANFVPKPKVDSAIITIEIRTEPIVLNFELIHKAFSGKRKMLRSTIGAEICEKAGIDPTRRPETVSIEEWEELGKGMS